MGVARGGSRRRAADRVDPRAGAARATCWPRPRASGWPRWSSATPPPSSTARSTAGSRIIGINNRDLATFETRIETTLALLPLIPPGPIVVSESGFFHGDQVRQVVAAGAHAVLVGEGLVRASDVGGKVRELTLR